MADVINIGIVGCGRILPAHLRGYKELRERGYDRFRIVALCDSRPEEALRFRKRGEGPPPRRPVATDPGDPLSAPHMYVEDAQGPDIAVEVYADLDQMLAEAPLDAVDIMTPVSLHHSQAIAALRAGKHVQVEKPMGITVRGCKRLLEEAEAAAKVVTVGECLRYALGTRATRWVLDHGDLGSLQSVLFWAFGNPRWSPDLILAETSWRHKKVLAGGGVAYDFGVHLFNLLRYVGGEISSIYGTCRAFEPVRVTRDASGKVTERVDNEVDDTFFATCQFTSGALAQVSFSVAMHGPPAGIPGGIALYGSKGAIREGQVHRDGQPAIALQELFYEEANEEARERLFPLGLTDWFALEKYDWLHAIETGGPPEMSGEEGLLDVAYAYGIMESSQVGRPVAPGEVLSGTLDGYQREIDRHLGLV